MHSDYTMLMSLLSDDEAHRMSCSACAITCAPAPFWRRYLGAWRQVVHRRFDAAPLLTPSPAFTAAVMAGSKLRRSSGGASVG